MHRYAYVFMLLYMHTHVFAYIYLYFLSQGSQDTWKSVLLFVFDDEQTCFIILET